MASSTIPSPARSSAAASATSLSAPARATSSRSPKRKCRANAATIGDPCDGDAQDADHLAPASSVGVRDRRPGARKGERPSEHVARCDRSGDQRGSGVGEKCANPADHQAFQIAGREAARPWYSRRSTVPGLRPWQTRTRRRDSDSANPGSNPCPSATDLPDMTVYFQFPRSGGSWQPQGSHFHAVLDSLQRRSVYDWRKKPWIDDHS
jgi:hypothetical protein